MYGAAAPFTIEKLPASRLKLQLERLPAPARNRALTWLHDFDFPEHDLDHLSVDQHGGVFYVDSQLPEAISQADLEANPQQAGITPTDVFALHSKPGASRLVYLNFQGYTIANTAWNNGNSLIARSFDTDGSPATFSESERRAIAEIWHRASEDFAPFDIDVTTEAPAVFGPQVGHVLITRNTDANGQAMPSSSAGGVAYVNVWGRADYPFYQPALVYYNNLSSFAPFIAEAASHELGHNLALSHDGTSSTAYYTGHGSGLSSWAAIMGVGYNTNVTQWSKGEYADANNTQDDLAIIGQRLGYRADDHSAGESQATPLLVDSQGFIASSNPEFDAGNTLTENKGIINNASDVDLFYFDTGTGEINLTVTPAWAAFTRSDRRGANLDIKATLKDSLGTVLVSDSLTDTHATLNTSLPAGRYFLEISGTGNASIPYSDYASLGQYFISGQVVPLIEDTTAPNPNPMQWLVAPETLDKTRISMTAEQAVDDSGVVSYQFVCTQGASGCTASAWQAKPDFIAGNLTPGAEYTFQVKARDIAGNETGLSVAASAITLENLAPIGRNDSVETGQNTPISIAVLANDDDPDGDSLSILSLTVPAHGDSAIDSQTLTYTPDADFIGTDSFTYTVSDGYDTATATVSVNVIQVNQAPVSQSDSYQVLINGSAVLDVLANDSDPEGQALTLISASQGNKGSTVINSNGTITYTPAANKRGGDSFSYTVSDGERSAHCHGNHRYRS